MDGFLQVDLLASVLEVYGYAVICGLAGGTIAIFVTYSIFKAFGFLNTRI